jgi:hypothetical protein
MGAVKKNKKYHFFIKIFYFINACKENDIPIVYGNNWMTKHCTAFGCNLLITNNQNMKDIWINRETAAAQRKITRGG